MTALMVGFALLMDRLLGEPNRFHHLVGFGRVASWVEHRLRRDDCTKRQGRFFGLLAVLILVVPLVVFTIGLMQLAMVEYLIATVLLYLAVGSRSLALHAQRVHDALTQNDLEEARKRIGMLVSRDTRQLDEEQVTKATVESVLENGCDAVFGAIFWFVVAGAPGVIAYRLINTLDAMWGYRNERYLHFGWAAARLDDLLNYIPARLTALTYAVLGHFNHAIRCWHEQGQNWKSPNAGPVMAAGAGALSVKLGGEATYHGQSQQRPTLGLAKRPYANDIQRAITLVNRGVLLWIVLILLGGWLLA